ncbi:MAG: MFS transporter, partial [Clostridioides sp.]|nr:MFS transporter [Clostridioides sp.]
MSNTATQKQKYPVGFWFCCTTFSFERAAYYTAKLLIYMFITKTALEGGLGMDVSTGSALQSYLVAFTYLAPI